MDRTMAVAAINVTGPFAKTLLRHLGLADPPSFLGHVRAEIAGVPCHIMRLSFTGETAFELHHPPDRSVDLWRGVLPPGARGRVPAPRLLGVFWARLRDGREAVVTATPFYDPEGLRARA